MGTERFAGNVSIGVDGFLRYEVFGQEVWITTTHIGMGLITVTLLIIAVTVNRTVRRAAPDQSPSGFLNVIEMMVEAIDRLTLTNMGKQHGHKFSNYIGTLFLFLMLSNMAGVFGLRSPTADYGVTLANLALHGIPPRPCSVLWDRSCRLPREGKAAADFFVPVTGLESFVAGLGD